MELAHCAIDVKDFVEQRPAVWQRREGVVPELDHVLLKHEDQEFFLRLGVEEERSGADVGLFGDLARRRPFETLIRKEPLCCRSDALQLFALVALAAPHRLFGFARLAILLVHDCAHFRERAAARGSSVVRDRSARAAPCRAHRGSACGSGAAPARCARRSDGRPARSPRCAAGARPSGSPPARSCSRIFR